MKDYIITKDIVNLFKRRFNLVLTRQQEEEIDTLENEAINSLRGYISDEYNLTILDEIKVDLPKDVDSSPLYLDDVHFDLRGESLSVTRSLPIEDLANDYDSKKIRARANEPCLDEQIENLKNNSYYFVDVGIFSGETLFGIVEKLRKKGKKINQAYVNVCNQNSVVNLNNKTYLLDNEKKEIKDLEIISSRERKFNLGEWIELRDFLGFDGRTLFSDGRTTICYSTHFYEHATIKKENCEIAKAISNFYFKKIFDIASKTNPYFTYHDSIIQQKDKNNQNQEYILRSFFNTWRDKNE